MEEIESAPHDTVEDENSKLKEQVAELQAKLKKEVGTPQPPSTPRVQEVMEEYPVVVAAAAACVVLFGALRWAKFAQK